MRYYPLGIDTKNKNVLVVGGGRAAYLKIKQLVNTWANITVISKQFCNEIINLQKTYSEKLILQSKNIDIENIDIEKKYNIVFICTESKELNMGIYNYFYDGEALVMMSNNKENSDFITMSVMEKENITLSVGTEGRSPTASKLVLNEVEKILNQEFIEKISLLCEIRELLINEKNKNSNVENISSIMDCLTLYSNNDLMCKVKMLKEIKCTGEHK